MNGKKSIRFELLGLFSWGKEEDDEWRRKTAGKKELSLLQYLIVNHARSVSSEELIERFWAQGSSDPINALRGMIYKVKFIKSGNICEKCFPKKRT